MPVTSTVEPSPANPKHWRVERRGIVVGDYLFRKHAHLAAEAADGDREQPTAILVSTSCKTFTRFPVKLDDKGVVPKLLQIGTVYLVYVGYDLSAVKNDFRYEIADIFRVRGGETSSYLSEG